VSRLSAAERARRSAVARATAIAATRPTTRAGSERTPVRLGDEVRVARTERPSGTWSRYAGRTGWVVALNTQRFPNGRSYVEIGVSWARSAQPENDRTDCWFRGDEVEPVLVAPDDSA